MTDATSSVLHLKLNDTNTHLALKRSNSGHLQLLLPDERPDEVGGGEEGGL